LDAASSPSSHAHNERDQENNEEKEKQNLGDTSRRDSNTTKSKNRRDQRDYKEN
jgi:hypothetical protein